MKNKNEKNYYGLDIHKGCLNFDLTFDAVDEQDARHKL